MIVRSKPTAQYTTVPNGTLRDTTLSFRARGILTYILSMPADWTITAAVLATRGTEGRDAVRMALRELRDAGYIVTTRHQDDIGRWNTVHTVYDQPVHDAVNDAVDNPSPESDSQSSVNQALKDKRPLEKENKRAMGLTDRGSRLCTNCDGAGWLVYIDDDDIADRLRNDNLARCTQCRGDGLAH